MSTQTAITTAPISVQPTVSRNVRVLLMASDWDQGDLSLVTGLSEPQVSRKMKGKGSSWTVDDLAILAAAFTARLGFTVTPGWFYMNVDELIGQNLKKLNGSDLRILDGGAEGGQERFGHLHLVPAE